MSAHWKKEYKNNVSEIVQRLESAKSIGTSNQIWFDSLQFSDLKAILFNLIEFCKDIPEIECLHILENSIHSVAKFKKLTPKNIIVEVQKSEQLFLKSPFTKYVFCTSLSINMFSTIKQKKIGDSLIQFDSYLPTKFQNCRRELVAKAESTLKITSPNNYKYIRIFVSGRSKYEAVIKAIEDFDLLRGIWNFCLNRSQWLRITYGLKIPINRLIKGPISTLHGKDGLLATNTWWYDPYFTTPVKPFNIDQYIQDLFKIEKSIRHYLNDINYNEKIKWAFKEYSRAIDHNNWIMSYLKLWTILEVLTCTTEKESYKITVRRTSFLFQDSKYHEIILYHLRDLRNSFIHENQSSEELETNVYQLKRYVETLIDFHLSMGRYFNNLYDVSEFLDISKDNNAILKKINLYKKALKYRS